MARAAAFLRHYLLAVQFFTRLPVTGALAQWVGFSPAMLRASAAHFPGVGWLVGMAACATFAALALGLPSTPLAVLAAAAGSTLCTVLLTGAFHEDGLADAADGLGGSADREQALAIMKDSRIGSYGAVALVLVLLCKVALLAVLGSVSLPTALAALLAAHVVSRFWPLVLIATLQHVGDSPSSKSKPLADRLERGALAAGAAWCVVPCAIAALVQDLAFLAGGLLAGGLVLAWLRSVLARRLGGFTGDTLGAAQQASELAFYLGAALALGR